jgi:hypothetical protein
MKKARRCTEGLLISVSEETSYAVEPDQYERVLATLTAAQATGIHAWIDLRSVYGDGKILVNTAHIKDCCLATKAFCDEKFAEDKEQDASFD